MGHTVAAAADRAAAKGLKRGGEGVQFGTADACISTHEPSSRMHQAVKLYIACATYGRAMPGKCPRKIGPAAFDLQQLTPAMLKGA